MRRRGAKFVVSRRPIRADRSRSCARSSELDAETRRSSGATTVIADLEAGDSEVDDSSFEGQRIAFPAHAREEIEALLRGRTSRSAPPSCPATLDEAGRLVLVRRLVREGFLRVSLDASSPRSGAARFGSARCR